MIIAEEFGNQTILLGNSTHSTAPNQAVKKIIIIIQKKGVLSHFAKSMGKGQEVGNEHRMGRSRSGVFTSQAPTHYQGTETGRTGRTTSLWATRMYERQNSH